MNIQLEKKIGNKMLCLETGKVAKLANGAVLVRYGDTMVLVTAVMSKEAREDVDFLPLYVDYRERTYAAGRIPGGFFKREGRPREKETLTSRLIDRPLRPLFSDDIRNEIQIIGTALSADEEIDPDILAIVGASAALVISDIPLSQPVGAVRIGRVNGELILNPTYEEMDKGDLNLVVCTTRKGVVMVEGWANQVSEEVVLQAIEMGWKGALEVVELIEELQQKGGKEKVELAKGFSADPASEKKVRAFATPKIIEANNMPTKHSRQEKIDSVLKEAIEKFSDKIEERKNYIKWIISQIEREEVRRKVIEEGRRVDGRGYKDLRPISCEVGVLPRTHGSALFTRGETQSLVVTTLGTFEDEQILEELKGESSKTFMLHYNFPPFSVGETQPMRGPGRREIGHGVLAEKALLPVLPDGDDFPYTIRIVSDILESNGSSSMATVCGSSLSLMDAGVPVKAAVAGVAMGLVVEGDKKAILTDILGVEDHYGDMDFKISGTSEGITVLQMDLKKGGVDLSLIEEALRQGKEARLHILEIMNKTIDHPRPHLAPHAPHIGVITIPLEKIGDLIGPGGRIIRSIIKETGAKIDVDDLGKVTVVASSEEAKQKALEKIKETTEEVEVGRIYMGKVTRIQPFGAFVEVLPGQEGMIHISQLDRGYVKKVEDVVKVGEKILVKVIGIDEEGRINLSRKQAMGKGGGEESRTGRRR